MENEINVLKIFYLGYKYYGFSTQKDVPTVEGYLREVLRDLVKDRKIHITYSSRTDRGVHAIGQIITINVSNLDIDNLNIKLPEDIAIWAYAKAPKNFDARRGTIYRHYKYIIQRKDLDLERIKNALKDLIGVHDFRKFCYKIRGPVIRRIYYAKTEKTEDGYVIIEFIGSKFARGLIRNLITLLMEIGSGKLNYTNIWDFNGKLHMAPPENLYLVNSYYPLNYKINDIGVEKVLSILNRRLSESPEEAYILREMLKDFRRLLNEIKEFNEIYTSMSN
ncbi:MAG: tRNA pseudouridine(38-40) synthase TruA [Candidatus Methanomethylicia archaeon]